MGRYVGKMVDENDGYLLIIQLDDRGERGDVYVQMRLVSAIFE